MPDEQKNKEKEYYWSEMWYNNLNKDIEEIEVIDIYEDMEWWYRYLMKDWID